MVIYVFDGSIEGLLTSVFDSYERKEGIVKLISKTKYQPQILDDVYKVIADEVKSKRVWEGLKRKVSEIWQMRFYKAFLSETEESYQSLFDFCRYVFDNPKGSENNFAHPAIMTISKMDKSVNRERHRMKAFVRFKETADGFFYASVEPDFNVLPLITTFFRNRYADQKWIIYDLKRRYGFYFDLNKVQEIVFDETPDLKKDKSDSSDKMSEKEDLYSLLWSDYFKSTNIPARKNTKLHIRHVPKRYWKYLTEKQENFLKSRA